MTRQEEKNKAIKMNNYFKNREWNIVLGAAFQPETPRY